MPYAKSNMIVDGYLVSLNDGFQFNKFDTNKPMRGSSVGQGLYALESREALYSTSTSLVTSCSLPSEFG